MLPPWVQSMFITRTEVLSSDPQTGNNSTYLHKRFLLVWSGTVNNSNIQRHFLFHHLAVCFQYPLLYPCTRGKSSQPQEWQTATGHGMLLVKLLICFSTIGVSVSPQGRVKLSQSSCPNLDFIQLRFPGRLTINWWSWNILKIKETHL